MIRNHIIYNSASDWRFDLVKALGVYLWDKKGKRYLDFTSGWNVTNLGWNNPEITKAVIDQAKKNFYAPMETADQIQVDLAASLVNSLPDNLSAVGRATGGVEANEEAIKTARAYTRRNKVLGFHHEYHGQSILMMSIFLDKEEMSTFGPQYKDVVRLNFPRAVDGERNGNILKKFEAIIDKALKNEDIAAVLVEPGIISGWGSTYVAPEGFVKLLRKLTNKYGSLLILDEIGTGFSRCGELYGMNIEGVVPDIATFAKGFSNGAAAIGAMVTTEEIAGKTWKYTNLQSTFGWIPISCAAAKKNLEIHIRDKIWQKSKKDGEYMRKVLSDELSNLEIINEIRGLGMEIGLSFKNTKGDPDENTAISVMNESVKHGLYVLYGDDGNLQLMPPLVMERKDLEKGLQILVDAVKSKAK